MQKLKLDVERLTVDSFPTTNDPTLSLGTVRGAQQHTEPWTCGLTCVNTDAAVLTCGAQTCNAPNNTCYDTCGGGDTTRCGTTHFTNCNCGGAGTCPTGYEVSCAATIEGFDPEVV